MKILCIIWHDKHYDDDMWMCWYSRYYYWYPIDYSPAPLYCYLFKQVSYLIFMNRLLQVLLLRYLQHYLLFLHSVPMRTMSRWLRLWWEVDIQATTSLTATTSTTLSPGWLLVLIFVTFFFAGRMCVRWKLALLGLLSDEQGLLQGGECLIQMMNIDVCHQGQLTGESQRIKFTCI